MALVPAVTAPIDEPRTHGVLLASVLLALPGVIAARGSAGSLILAFSAITAALLIERRPRAALRISEVTRPAMPTAVQLRSGPCARWELVERDGRSSLEVHWR